jgi:hypothetical protein
MAVICAIAGAAIFILLNNDRKDFDDYLFISIISVLCSSIWPLEIVVGLVFGACVWVSSIKKQMEVKKRNENER